MEVLCPKLVSAIASTPEPSAVAVGSNPALDKKPFSIRATAQPELGGLPLVRRNSATTLLSVLLPLPTFSSASCSQLG